MNYLNGKTVYLCGSIYGSSDDGISWREEITPRLKGMGIEVLDPCKKMTEGSGEVGNDKKKFRELIMLENFSELKEIFWPIVRYDLRCVDLSNFIIVKYDPNVHMVGGLHEIFVANFEKKVILLKYDKKDLKHFNPWMATFIKPHHFFSEWDQMFEYLGKVNDGILDTSLWVI